jgi:hypothetical protein
LTNHKLDPVRPCSVSLAAQTRRATSTAIWPQTSSARISPEYAANIFTMANRGYDVVVDVDQEVRTYNLPSHSQRNSRADISQGDLGHTDLQEDLEFHSSSNVSFSPHPPANQLTHFTTDFDTSARGAPKIQPDSLPNPSTSSTSSRKHYLWTLSFYAQAFDVDTNEVLRRCKSSIYPRANFLDVLEGNPDLYGPVWIATTVVVILFLTGTINQYLAQKGEGRFVYDFKLLSGAAGLVYGYTAFVPVGLWAVLKWFGSESANLLECACLYGYANLVWIVVALVSWSPISSKLSNHLTVLPHGKF